MSKTLQEYKSAGFDELMGNELVAHSGCGREETAKFLIS